HWFGDSAMRVAAAVLSVAAVVLCVDPGLAQTGSLRVSIPSPTAASLGKFGDVPVSLYTGIPDITVPLFTAHGRTLPVPIALHYYAGGVKVEERGGWVGLGWSLAAGGGVHRTVHGGGG